jgi:hypothetical protein
VPVVLALLAVGQMPAVVGWLQLGAQLGQPVAAALAQHCLLPC